MPIHQNCINIVAIFENICKFFFFLYVHLFIIWEMLTENCWKQSPWESSTEHDVADWKPFHASFIFFFSHGVCVEFHYDDIARMDFQINLIWCAVWYRIARWNEREKLSYKKYFFLHYYYFFFFINILCCKVRVYEFFFFFLHLFPWVWCMYFCTF